MFCILRICISIPNTPGPPAEIATPAHLDFWARRKGIQLLGTGDFTHPAWRAELAEKLIPAEDGLYRLRDDARLPDSVCQTSSRTAVCSVRGNQFHLQKRRPNPQGSQCNSAALSGGCRSPRPPAGSHRQYPFGWASHPWAGQPGSAGNYAGCLPSRRYLSPPISGRRISPCSGLFPALTPWRSALATCPRYIHAVETGLSSDPPMNWRVSALDRFTLVSNSDAHSPAKLGREANLLDTDLSYPALAKALQTGKGLCRNGRIFSGGGEVPFRWASFLRMPA